MYSGLREKLIRNKTFRKGRLVDVVGKDKLVESVNKLNPSEKYIFIYDDDFNDEKNKINPNNFKNSYFDFGGIYPSDGIIYFRISRYLWEGAPIDKLYNIIPVKSIKKDNSLELKNLKLYNFWGKGLNHTEVLHFNPVEAFLQVQENFPRGLRNCRLSEITQLEAGMSFEHKDDRD